MSVGTPYTLLQTSGFLVSPIYVRTFRADTDSKEFYVRLFEDRDGTDLLITFGPMSKRAVGQFISLLSNTHCHIEERNEAPFERAREEFEE